MLLVALAGAVTTATLLPLVYLGDRALQRGWTFVADELGQARTLALVGRSAALVVVVTAACVVLGTVFAVLVTRTTFPGRGMLRVVLTLPLAIPSYLLAYLWISLSPDIAGFWGACLILTLVSYPYVLLTTAAALVGTDPAQEEVARSLGLSPVAVLFRVTLRQVRPAITAGALLVALYVLSDFGAVAAMRYEAFTWVIYASYVSHGLPGIVVAIAMVSVGVLLLRPFYQQAPLLILAYTVLFVALAVGSVRAALESATPQLEEVARSLGRSPARAFTTVTARLAAPGIAAGTALVLLSCMKELPVTLLLHPTGSDSLATRLWTFASVSNYAAAAPYAAALLVFAAIPTAVLATWSARVGRVPGD